MHARSDLRFDLNRKLRVFKQVKYFDLKQNKTVVKEVPDEFIKPWPTLTQDIKNKLECVLVSFKQNNRIINKTGNLYQKYVLKNGRMVKELVKQTKGDGWAIRKPLHKDTVTGKVILNDVKISEGEVLTASRKPIDSNFNLKNIEKITDKGIRKILINFLKFKENKPELAFSPEGLEELNKNIELFNDGKPHKPIYKVRIYEKGKKFPLGQSGNKKSKYVEAEKGTNLFFAIYQDENGTRNFDSVPLITVIERLKQGLKPVPETNEKGDRLLFYLMPNDLVYVPTVEEKENLSILDFNHFSKDQYNRIYKMVSCTGDVCHFVHYAIASLIKNYDATSKIGELGSINKLETTMYESVKIKEECIKLKTDRLGNILYAVY